MPARIFDIDLQTQEPPFLYTDEVRTNILSDIPEALPYTTNTVRPQGIYIKDMLPSKYGFDSIDRSLEFTNSLDDAKFESVFPFYDNNNGLHFLARTDSTIYRADDGFTQWVAGPSGFDFTEQFSKTFLFGNTFFFAQGSGRCYRFDANLGDWAQVTFLGITSTNLLGICSASGYFIAFDDKFIYWTTSVNLSTNKIDFTPVLGTAGADQILDIKSGIVTVLPISRGFMVYGLQNVVSGSFSGNSSVPWNYAEVLNSAGTASAYQVCSDENTGYHYAWTRAGLQQLAVTGASDLFPELLEFINNKTIESLDVPSGVFTRTVLTDLPQVRVGLIGNRFLTISYGPTLLPEADFKTFNDFVAISYEETDPHSYNFYSTVDNFPVEYDEAVIYDLDLKRWGKIVEPHTHLFNYSFVSAPQYITYLGTDPNTYNDYPETSFASMVNYVLPKLGYKFGLLKSDGTILVMSRSNMQDISNQTSESVCVLGRIQFYPLGSQEVQTAEIEQFSGDAYIYTSYTDNVEVHDAVKQGIDITRGVNPGNSRRFGFRLAGKYSSFAFAGKMHLTTAIFLVNRTGSR